MMQGMVGVWFMWSGRPAWSSGTLDCVDITNIESKKYIRLLRMLHFLRIVYIHKLENLRPGENVSKTKVTIDT